MALLRDLTVEGKSPSEAGIPESGIIHVPTVLRKRRGAGLQGSMRRLESVVN